MMDPSFEKLLAILAEAGVHFIIVGGVAVTLQGYTRVTEDIDLLLEDSAENLTLLLGTLSDYGEGFARELSLDDFSEDEAGAIRIVETVEHCQMDLFTVMSGRKYADVIQDSEFFILNGHRVAYASKNSLIGWKAGSFREKDRLDVLALRRLQENPRAFD